MVQKGEVNYPFFDFTRESETEKERQGEIMRERKIGREKVRKKDRER